MKETIHVNIASQAFTLDLDAYRTLRDYFDRIRARLPKGDTETMEDIEARMAEIFRERLSSPMMVITLGVVRAAMEQMGRPSDFGYDAAFDDADRTAPRRLTRSRTDRSIAGICGGIAAFFGIDPSLVRLVTLLLILAGGLSLWAYVILWIVIPDEPEHAHTRNYRHTDR